MKIIIATRDLDYGVGSVVKLQINKFDSDKNIKKVYVIGPKKLEGYSNKVEFEIIENIGKFFITKQPNFAFKCNKKIRDIIKKERIDEIYLNYPIWAENYGVKLITKFHGLNRSIIKNHPRNLIFLIASTFNLLYSYFDHRTIKYSDKVFFVSRKTLEEAKEFYPKYKNKFYYSNNEVDKSKFFELTQKEKKKIKKELGLDDKKINILYVGRLDPMKGIMELVNSIEYLNNRNIQLIVIGNGSLKNKIEKYSFVNYRGGVANEELYKYYNAVDIFVLPSYYENSPITLLEAKACRCKIIASDVGDNTFNLSKEEIYKSKEKFALLNKLKVIIKKNEK